MHKGAFDHAPLAADSFGQLLMMAQTGNLAQGIASAMTVMPGESGASETNTSQSEQQLETGAIPCARYVVNTPRLSLSLVQMCANNIM